MVYYRDKIEFEATCTGITIDEWNELMKGSVKANGSKIRQMIKTQLPDIWRAISYGYNPYEHQCRKTKTHYIYVWSAVEFFLRRL